MNKNKSRPIGSLRNAGKLGLSALPLGLLLATAFGTQVQALSLSVQGSGTRTGVAFSEPVTIYKYIINVDNTGTTEQRAPTDGCSPSDPTSAYPGTLTPPEVKPCNWVSIAGVPGSSPIYTQGVNSDLTSVGVTGHLMPPGKYLISVLADGYKLDGKHFTVPASGIAPNLAITLHANGNITGDDGLPAATIQAAVFEDISPTNGAPDVPAERGLAGFQGHIFDYIDEVTTDINGDPLCGTGICVSQCYVVDNAQDIGTVTPPPSAGGRCPTIEEAVGGGMTPISPFTATEVPSTAAIEGKLKIPNLGPNRYALSITAPDGSTWQQTTTLEGNLDYDTWVMEGATGLDTEFVVAGEPFPAVIFGYVERNENNSLGGGGTITGVIDAVKIYVPTNGGVALPGTIWGGLAGGKLDGPVPSPWLSLTGLNVGDTAIWTGQGNPDGSFTIPNVPDGNYTLTWWDTNLNYILDLVQVSVVNGETVDMGILPLTGWWTKFEGYVYNDINKNGKKDTGEPGLANYPVVMRKRENSLMDRGAVAVNTDQTGHYVMENAYPMTQWLVMEAYDDGHYSTGITYQADNQPTETTVPGEGVDVSVLPIIGLSGRLDWGKHSYEQGTNGGIVGTVSYGTTRNETDPRYAAIENWQPGVSNLDVKLYAPVVCPLDPDSLPLAIDPNTNLPNPCKASEGSGIYYKLAADGSFLKADANLLTPAVIDPIQTYTTETWQRPSGCLARGVDGNPVVGEQVLPKVSGTNNQDTTKECLEGPLMGVQFGPMPDDPLAPTNFGAAVDGNYGFGDIQSGDYLVEVEVPKDALGKPMYKFTSEEDINIANGDTFVPAAVPPECAGPLHTVDVAADGTTDEWPAITGDGGVTNNVPVGVTVPVSTPVVNSTFLDIGGSPYEGQQKPLCNMKMVRLANGKSVAPTFEVFTDVPLPGRFWGLAVDDLNFASDAKSLMYGEKNGIPFAPVGIYDYSNTLVHTAETDFNGLFDVLLPSTNRISCPTPSGVCANLYRFVGNDPGTPGQLNLNYHPEFRTIAAEFEAFPGLIVPADLAPSQVGVTVQLPGGQVAQPLSCPLNVYSGANITPPEKLVPELMAVAVPYVNDSGSVNISGDNFGTKTGPANVYLDGTVVPTTAWSNISITMNVTANLVAPGPHQLTIVSANGQKTVNGLTFHVRGGAYIPTVVEVGPGKTYSPVESLPGAADHAIQDALDAAPANALVVVYPNTNTPNNPRQNPRGAYYENLIVSKSVKLQGVGPGGIRRDGTTVKGTIIDGSAFGGDSPVAADWYTAIGALTWAGNQTVYDGAVISIYTSSNAFTNTIPSIDGFDLRGGDQQGFPNNINVIGGTPTGLPPNVVTQGGAIYANAYAHNLRITNNVIQNNGGSYGTVRIGTPNLQGADTDQHNDNVRIADNRIIANGGTNLAGGIGLFAGSSNYEVDHNDICGNFSAEYGGGITAYGLNYNGAIAYNATTNFGGKIHHNRLYFNRSYDEGGAIMIAGQLTSDPATLSPGAGPVQIYSNLIQSNLANDDGGGIRFLQAAADCAPAADTYTPCNSDVVNNMIVNNVSTHEGGGISLNDAPNVRVVNNTIMKNITTATAATSTGSPAPAGLSTSLHSSQLLAALPVGADNFSNPLLFNNILWDNRAGARSGSNVTGIGAAGDATPINQFDLGASDGSGVLSPTNSFIQQSLGYNDVASNRHVDPQVVTPYDTVLDFAAWRNNPAFLGAILVTADLTPNLLGDYHLLLGSPAINLGTNGPVSGVRAPDQDIDDGNRTGNPDVGADEQGQAGSGLPGGGSGGGGPVLPALTVLDQFNRASANTLNNGTNWSQVTISSTSPAFIGNVACNVFNWGTTAPCAAIHVTGPVANGIANGVGTGGAAYWNGTGNVFGANQGAAFTFANTTLNNDALILKASGGSAIAPVNFIRVLYQTASGGRVLVQTTTNGGLSYTTRATFTVTNPGFNNNSTLSAVARADGSVAVFKTVGTTTTLVGSVIIPTTGVGAWTQGASGGRIGMQLPSGARVDNFAGGTVP